MMNNPAEDNDKMNDFVQVIMQLTEAVNQLIHMESLKAETASLGRHELMGGLLKDEQVYILKLRGLEQRRVKLQDHLGWGGLTFRQILDKARKEQAAALSPLFIELEQQVRRLLDARDTAQRAIRLRLQEFTAALAGAKGLSYGENGMMDIDLPPHFHDRYV